MAITPELMMAILSMDAYNRAYGVGVEVSGTSVDSAVITTDSEEVFLTPDQEEGALSSAAVAGFYAVAYNWNSQTVISYRGTDNYDLGDPANDVVNGWVLGGGDLNAPQARVSHDLSL